MMKRHGLRAAWIALLLCTGFWTGLVAGDVVRLSEPVEATADYETFGAPLPAEGTALPLGTVTANSEKYLDREVKVATRIGKVCQKKGCFFVAQDGAATARITFSAFISSR